jgi:phospholipase A-2-activating protein
MKTGKFIVVVITNKRTKKVDKTNFRKTYKDAETLSQHSNFVSAVCVFNGGKWLATASNDNTICLYIFGSPQPFATLKDHTNTVCAVAQGLESATLISGSWDMTARIWNNLDINTNSIELKGHDAAVWAVATLPGSKYATGSADKNIFVWNGKGEKLVVLKGHTDCVRGLVALKDGSLLSCSNDATIRHWSDTYDCIKEFHGHANYIYGIALRGDDMFVTCGEDSSVRLWSITGGALGDSIKLPAQSIWDVACTESGDIVAGSSDGTVRVFTNDVSRFAPADILEAFKVAVDTRQAEQSKELGGVKVNDLPGPESLLTEGTEGQTRLVRQPNGKILCYQWTKGAWECVGDVMGGADSNKSLHEGKEYDFVFNVDIEDGAPPLKLPFNKTEDPYMAAQKFIHSNELPQVYLETVANFIITNAKLTNASAPTATSGFADPFTGEGRYIPGGGEVGAAGGTDPFTGTGRYIPGGGNGVDVNFRERSGNNNSSNNNVNLDPFTGGSSYTSGGTQGLVKKHIPYKTPTTFDVYDSSKILGKLKEFNEGAFPEDSLATAVGLIEKGSSYEVLEQLLKWPPGKRFPALDILRLFVRRGEMPQQFTTPIIENLTSTPPNQLMAMRALSNATGQAWVTEKLVDITEKIGEIRGGNANLQIAIATFFLNQSILQRADEICTSMSIAVVRWANEAEAIFRTYQVSFILFELLNIP